MSTSKGFERGAAGSEKKRIYIYRDIYIYYMAVGQEVSAPLAMMQVQNANMAGGLMEGCIAVDARDKLVKTCANNTTRRRRKVSFPAVHEAKQLGTLPQHSC